MRDLGLLRLELGLELRLLAPRLKMLLDSHVGADPCGY
jgi:hypothetical protein